MGRKFWVMVGPEQEGHGRVVVRTVQAFEPWSYGSVKEDETPARFVGVQVPGAEAERSGLIDMLLRNTKNPLDDPKNKQLIGFMDPVDFIRPKSVLMENVVDLFEVCQWIFRKICHRTPLLI
ncbi:hypothetical protein OIU85_028824 [Salix viminalis]|uniref:Uncharacterized protein n=1 Tax=Salix viminalis TaxID=40686 RepID=A0A9Q0T6Y3_SALVM|nr:hypothetical protein OIU85_028824 [Salix viminalis]